MERTLTHALKKYGALLPEFNQSQMVQKSFMVVTIPLAKVGALDEAHDIRQRVYKQALLHKRSRNDIVIHKLRSCWNIQQNIKYLRSQAPNDVWLNYWITIQQRYESQLPRVGYIGPYLGEMEPRSQIPFPKPPAKNKRNKTKKITK
jgi:hypothetical protein